MNKKGEIVVECQWRFPADGLELIDVDGAVTSLQNSLTELGLRPHSISGFAVTAEHPERSTGVQIARSLVQGGNHES